MKKIIKLVTPKEAVLYLYSMFFIIIQVGLEVAVPRKMGIITEMLQRGECNMEDILSQGGIMLLYSLLAMVATIISTLFITKAGATLDKCIRKRVFEKTMSFSLEEMGHFGTSSLIARCTSDITQVQSFVTGGLQNAVRSPVIIVLVIVCISGTHLYWTIATIVAVAIIVTMLTVITIITMPSVKRLQSVNDKLIETSREHITGIHTIHAYGAFDFQKNRYEKVNEEQTRLHLFYDKAMAIFNPGASAVLYLLSVTIYILGAYIITGAGSDEKLILFSRMVEFISYANLLISAFIYLIVIISNLPNTLVSANRISEVLDTNVNIVDSEEEKKINENDKGTIEFSHVSFRYPGCNANVLDDISFKINRGETLAIIGATGCGKTSILNLIPRLYDATEGTVYVDGIDVKDYKLNDLRNIIGYVPQKSMLFSGTIANNIDYGENGRFHATLAEIQQAARIGQAEEFIMLKENGYDTKVAQGGANFSGGQRQRLTISRAICRNPEIYLFDDSFSALDYKTDNMLRTKLREHVGNATMCIVGQRISTIRNADKIIVIDNGRIVGEGKHDELLKNCSVYREIALSQNIKEVE